MISEKILREQRQYKHQWKRIHLGAESTPTVEAIIFSTSQVDYILL